MRNTLIQYHGGGYDGCFWEWNYCWFDGNGVFHDIYSSGHAGCITKEQAQELLAEDHDSTYPYDTTDPKQIEEFSRESNPAGVLGVLRWFNDYNDPDVEFFAICSDCNENIYEDGTLEDWHGCGGIASTADTLLCSDCHSIGTCGCCNEYVGQQAFDFEQDTDDCSDETRRLLEEYCEDNGPVCQDCWENERDNLLAEERAELLSVSLATGTPDLFSDDMRWFW